MYYIITRKKLILSISIFFIVCVCSISCFVLASNNTSWGLSFSTPNETPRGNATSEELLKYNAYFTDSSDTKKVYLTFDVGYEAGYTNTILDTLKKQNVPAAFFIVGNFFDSDPDTVKRMCDEGHIVANHTLTHPDMSKMSTFEDFKAQIEPNEEKYKAITGKEMKIEAKLPEYLKEICK